jgi:centromere protein I
LLIYVKPFDAEWRTRLLAIQENSSQMSLDNPGIASGFKVHRNGAYKSKSKAIPEVQTFHAEEVSLIYEYRREFFNLIVLQTSVTLEEVNTVTDLVDNLERIEPPSQLIASLKDPLLQKFMLLGTSPDAFLRLEFWLERYFEEEIELLQEGFGLSTSLPEILSGILCYTEAAKVFAPFINSCNPC